MWGLPGPGLEPVSPALAGGFLTTVPPGKPRLASLSVWPVDSWVEFSFFSFVQDCLVFRYLCLFFPSLLLLGFNAVPSSDQLTIGIE